MSVFQDEVWFWGQEILDGGHLSLGYVGNTPLRQTLQYINNSKLFVSKSLSLKCLKYALPDLGKGLEGMHIWHIWLNKAQSYLIIVNFG